MGGKTGREWALRVPDPAVVRTIRDRTGLSPTAAAVLANRGITEAAEIERFLSGTLKDISFPFRMKDLEKAAQRIAGAGLAREPLLIYADYDADGATGAAVLHQFLTDVFPGMPVAVHQNHRTSEGYGLKVRRLEQAAAQGFRLVVTVDVGVSDVEAVAAANALGVDVVVTDHHMPGPVLPKALAVVNPKRRDCPYPGKDLAGAGVAFMVACAVRKVLRDLGVAGTVPLPNMRRYIDLVAVGTVADMVPLKGDNRTLVRAGLEEIRSRPRPGIRALFAVAGVDPALASEEDLAFRVAPRLNAAGRVGDSRRGFDVLVSGDPAESLRLAQALNMDNTRRQREEERILRSAEAALGDGAEAAAAGAIVLADPGWHFGVLGIVASRLAESYDIPAVLLRVEGEEARGSCRSAGGFPLTSALEELSPLLTRYGGHLQAAGLALPASNIAAFREGFGRIAARHAALREGRAELAADAKVRLGEITFGLMEELDRLRPFGTGNEEPRFMALNLRAGREIPFGEDGRHVRIEVDDGGERREAVAFRRSSLSVRAGELLDLVFTPRAVRFRNERSIRLMIRGVRPAGGDAVRPATPGEA